MIEQRDIELATNLGDRVLSASQLGLASKCGLAWKYRYIDELPSPHDTGAQLVGHVVHNGVAEWYKKQDHQSRPLPPLVLEQWRLLLPAPIWRAVSKLRELDPEREAVLAAICLSRPDLKQPGATRAYQDSRIAKEYDERKQFLLSVQDDMEEVRWPKNEGPYQAIANSLTMAESLQQRWQHLPAPIGVEHPFYLSFGGYALRGRIDQVRIDLDPITGELLEPVVLDIKSGRGILSQMEALLQAFLYTEACRQDPLLPNVHRVEFLHARTGKSQRGSIDPARHGPLAMQVLNGVATKLVNRQFEPSYGYGCRGCEFRDRCSEEISLWEGDGTGGGSLWQVEDLQFS